MNIERVASFIADIICDELDEIEELLQDDCNCCYCLSLRAREREYMKGIYGESLPKDALYDRGR